MSTDLAVTAVTRTIRQIIADDIQSTWGNILEGELTKSVEVTNLLPHKVRDKHATANVINIFLYKTDYNAAWRNMPLPSQGKPGEQVTPPLAINLEYLITAYGEDDKEEPAHYFLAQAMRILHDKAVLPRSLFKLVLESAKVHQQIESVTITPKPITIEELSKLWGMFQTQFRICASYLVTVLLIDSKADARLVLPVLKRGPDDSGVTALAGVLPVLDHAKPATGLTAARLGEDVVVHGERLDMSGLVARVKHPLMTDAIDLTVTNVDAGRVTFTLPPVTDPNVAADWPAGIYTVALSGKLLNNIEWATNSVSFPLAPTITVNPTQVVAPGGPFDVTIEATPQIREDDQDIVIIYGSAPKPVKSLTQPGNPDDPTAVVFEAPTDLGLHRVRLRVDGVDSIPIIKTIDNKFEFDPNQSVEVKP